MYKEQFSLLIVSLRIVVIPNYKLPLRIQDEAKTHIFSYVRTHVEEEEEKKGNYCASASVSAFFFVSFFL